MTTDCEFAPFLWHPQSSDGVGLETGEEGKALKAFLQQIGLSDSTSEKLLGALDKVWIGSLKELIKAYEDKSLAKIDIPPCVAGRILPVWVLWLHY